MLSYKETVCDDTYEICTGNKGQIKGISMWTTVIYNLGVPETPGILDQPEPLQASGPPLEFGSKALVVLGTPRRIGDPWTFYFGTLWTPPKMFKVFHNFPLASIPPPPPLWNRLYPPAHFYKDYHEER